MSRDIGHIQTSASITLDIVWKIFTTAEIASSKVVREMLQLCFFPHHDIRESGIQLQGLSHTLFEVCLGMMMEATIDENQRWIASCGGNFLVQQLQSLLVGSTGTQLALDAMATMRIGVAAEEMQLHSLGF